jgi:hypothetical protein
MAEPAKRQRGGQPGNKNALKHGYYARYLAPDRQQDFLEAAGVDGLDEEIALVRVAVKNAATGGDNKNLKPLLRAVNALDKLVRTRYRVAVSGREQQLREAISNVVRNFMVPLGVAPGKIVRKQVIKSNRNGR